MKKAIVFTGFFISSYASAGDLILAEYRGDQALTETAAWEASVNTNERAALAEGRWGQPASLRIQEISSSLQHDVPVGGFRLSGALDITHRQSYWVGEPYSRSYSVRFGPKFALSPASVFHLYYGFDQDATQRHSLGRGTDTDSTRTGLAHTWYLFGKNAEIRLGYEFEQGSQEDRYDDMQGHSINVSGRFNLFWGMNARLEADYSRVSYPEFAGQFGLESDRREFRAILSRSFGERLYGDLHYSYSDEDFDQSAPFQRRRTWGLNFRYEY